MDRDKLHDALLAEIADYETLLKASQSPADQQKQANFIKKWGYIVP